MLKHIALAGIAAVAMSSATFGKAPVAELTASQIVERNVAARGGLEAWRKIDTMVWVGHMESADPNVPTMTFMLEQKRPNKTHFETDVMGRRTMRVFDGARGWTLRPAAAGGVSAQSFTPQELQYAREAQGIDGPLIDYQAKGSTVVLAGIEPIEGRPAYKLHVALHSGEYHDVRIDTKTFLDVRYDRTSYTSAGKPGTVSVAYRNYQTVNGVSLPGMLEIGVDSGKAPDRMVIEKIALNPPLDDKTFGMPVNSRRSRMVTVDMTPRSNPQRPDGTNSDAAAVPPPGPTGAAEAK